MSCFHEFMLYCFLNSVINSLYLYDCCGLRHIADETKATPHNKDNERAVELFAKSEFSDRRVSIERAAGPSYQFYLFKISESRIDRWNRSRYNKIINKSCAHAYRIFFRAGENRFGGAHRRIAIDSTETQGRSGLPPTGEKESI